MPQFRFDESQQILTGPDGAEIKLRAQSLQVLGLLLKNSGQVVSRDVILSEVWGNTNVTDDSVTQCIADIRRTLGDEHRSILQTVPKKGYRLSPGLDTGGDVVIRYSVSHSDVDTSSSPTSVAEEGGLQAEIGDRVESAVAIPAELQNLDAVAGIAANPDNSLFNKRIGLVLLCLAVVSISASYVVWNMVIPRVEHNAVSAPVQSTAKYSNNGPTMAVLPFRDASNSSSQQYFSDGVTEDIIAALTRFSGLRVMSWSAVSQYQAEHKKLSEIADEFGIRYLVTGSIQRGDDRVRMSIKLSDMRSGQLLWTEQYDEQLEDVFLLQDKISKQVATTLSVKLTEIETKRVYAKPTESMAAYELILSARSKFRDRTRDQNLAARRLSKHAIELDSAYARAYIQLGETYLDDAVFAWSEWPSQSLEKAEELARKAAELDARSARSSGFLAMVYIRMGKYQQAQSQLNLAFEFNSNDPKLHEIQGLLFFWSGRPDEGIASLEYALQFDPNSTIGWSALGAAYYVQGRTLDAVALLERGLALSPNVVFVHHILAAAYAESGRDEDARNAASKVRINNPFFDAAKFSQLAIFNTETTKQRVLDSLRKAGL